MRAGGLYCEGPSVRVGRNTSVDPTTGSVHGGNVYRSLYSSCHSPSLPPDSSFLAAAHLPAKDACPIGHAHSNPALVPVMTGMTDPNAHGGIHSKAAAGVSKTTSRKNSSNMDADTTAHTSFTLAAIHPLTEQVSAATAENTGCGAAGQVHSTTCGVGGGSMRRTSIALIEGYGAPLPEVEATEPSDITATGITPLGRIQKVVDTNGCAMLVQCISCIMLLMVT